jgi:glycosyltransferase 2 family protein
MDKQKALKYGKFVIRWGIAIVGLCWVVLNMSWHDHALALLPGQSMPQTVTLADATQGEGDLFYKVIDPATGKTLQLSARNILSAPDRKNLQVHEDGKPAYVVGVDLSADLTKVNRLLLAPTPTGPTAHWADPSQVPDYHLTVPHPRVQIGVIRMVRQAEGHLWLLFAAVMIFPITIFITSFRWHELLKALDIRLDFSRVFVLNMVGLFYNSFMPGSTGGDLLKAIYVARQTHHRTRAVMSVLVDRAIGLVALIILGGTMAALQTQIPKCRQVAIGCAAILLVLAVGGTLFYVPVLRRLSGLDFLISKLPMRQRVEKAIETLHIFGKRPGLVAAAIIVSFPVHMVVIISAELCGTAFGIHISPFYYWMAVPVIILSGAIPISPQGAGVMEYFAIKLLEPQGVTVSQAFALTMSIRLVQMIWNVSGGYFVVRGGFHAPTPSEQSEVEAEDEDTKESEPANLSQPRSSTTMHSTCSPASIELS